MKVVALISLLFSSLAGATDICIDWEKKIEPDMQISESELTKEAAIEAHKAIGRLIESGQFEWFQPLNLQKFIYGYLLKQKALNAIESRGKQETKSLHEVEEFCQFLVEDAFYYD